MNPKPDDRRDNVGKIQRNISRTIQNIEMAEEMISKTSDPKTRKDLNEKNRRREDSLQGMRHEIRDEAGHQKKRENQ